MRAGDFTPHTHSPTTAGAASTAVPVFTTRDAFRLVPCRWCGAQVAQFCCLVRDGWPPRVERVPMPHLCRVQDARQLLWS